MTVVVETRETRAFLMLRQVVIQLAVLDHFQRLAKRCLADR